MISIQCTQWNTPKKRYHVQELKLSQIEKEKNEEKQKTEPDEWQVIKSILWSE